MKTYKALENGREILVPEERWAWGAKYTDGTQLLQFDEEGRFHRIGEVDQTRLEAFGMFKPGSDPTKAIFLMVGPGMKVVHKYNVHIRDAGTPSEVRHRVFTVGLKDGKHASFLTILPDDRIVMSHDDADVGRFIP